MGVFLTICTFVIILFDELGMTLIFRMQIPNAATPGFNTYQM